MGFADMAREVMKEIRREEKTCLRPISKPSDCFDPDGILPEVIAFWQDRQDGEAQCIAHIDQMVADGMLQSPWGFKVKGSPVMGGDYWIVSCPEARARIPQGDRSFTLTELKPIVETCKVFNGKVVEVKYRAIEAVNA